MENGYFLIGFTAKFNEHERQSYIMYYKSTGEFCYSEWEATIGLLLDNIGLDSLEAFVNFSKTVVTKAEYDCNCPHGSLPFRVIRPGVGEAKFFFEKDFFIEPFDEKLIVKGIPIEDLDIIKVDRLLRSWGIYNTIY